MRTFPRLLNSVRAYGLSLRIKIIKNWRRGFDSQRFADSFVHVQLNIATTSMLALFQCGLTTPVHPHQFLSVVLSRCAWLLSFACSWQFISVAFYCNPQMLSDWLRLLDGAQELPDRHISPWLMAKKIPKILWWTCCLVRPRASLEKQRIIFIKL